MKVLELRDADEATTVTVENLFGQHVNAKDELTKLTTLIEALNWAVSASINASRARQALQAFMAEQRQQSSLTDYITPPPTNKIRVNLIDLPPKDAPVSAEEDSALMSLKELEDRMKQLVDTFVLDGDQMHTKINAFTAFRDFIVGYVGKVRS